MLKAVDPAHVAVGTERVAPLVDSVERSIKGKRAVIELAVAALLARGHVLFEDVPGVGKTTLSLALAKSLGLTFRRVQCTSDLLPSDIIGVVVFDQKTSEFGFRPGPLFANVVLVDEINRATPKTQSALLEAMGEATVSVERQIHQLPQPFWVVATQNPLDARGTHPLPENQLDRFLMRLSIGYPDAESERAIVLGGGAPVRPDQLSQVVTPVDLARWQQEVDEVRVDVGLGDYVVQLCQRTRQDPAFGVGASTRAAVALMAASRALAWVRGRDFVIPDDVIHLWLPVMGHRVSLKQAQDDRVAVEMALAEVLRQVRVPD